MQLSQHFTLGELIVSQTAARRGIDNAPPIDVLERLKRTAQGLELVRARLGESPIIVSSGYRSRELNDAVGGARNSQHMLGEAADFTCPRYGTPSVVAYAIAESDIPYDQLILEYGQWVHISFSHARRRDALVIDRTGTRPLFA